MLLGLTLFACDDSNNQNKTEWAYHIIYDDVVLNDYALFTDDDLAVQEISNFSCVTLVSNKKLNTAEIHYGFTIISGAADTKISIKRNTETVLREKYKDWYIYDISQNLEVRNNKGTFGNDISLTLSGYNLKIGDNLIQLNEDKSTQLDIYFRHQRDVSMGSVSYALGDNTAINNSFGLYANRNIIIESIAAANKTIRLVPGTNIEDLPRIMDKDSSNGAFRGQFECIGGNKYGTKDYFIVTYKLPGEEELLTMPVGCMFITSNKSLAREYIDNM